MSKKFQLRYLPLFYEDLKETINYISKKLFNPSAAMRLLSDIEEAIKDRLPNCDSFEPYRSVKSRENDYYYIKVKNFMVFYVVLNESGEKVMECRRLLYKGRNIDDILK